MLGLKKNPIPPSPVQKSWASLRGGGPNVAPGDGMMTFVVPQRPLGLRIFPFTPHQKWRWKPGKLPEKWEVYSWENPNINEGQIPAMFDDSFLGYLSIDCKLLSPSLFQLEVDQKWPDVAWFLVARPKGLRTKLGSRSGSARSAENVQGFKSFNCRFYPLVMTNIAIENGNL